MNFGYSLVMNFREKRKKGKGFRTSKFRLEDKDEYGAELVFGQL
jgi:hypothetical protein